MSKIRITGEFRTDYDTELTGAPSERWAEAVFLLSESNEELVFEVSVEDSGTVVGIMIGEDTKWKGTLSGFKKMLQEAK